MNIPSIINAGDTQQWLDIAFRDALGGNVSSGSYALSYAFRGPGAAFDLAGAPQGTGWQFTLAAADSAALNTGASALTWYWMATATNAGTRLTAGDGTLVVRPNLVALNTGAFDGRSQAEKDLAAVRAEITARVNGGAVTEYTIGTRSLKKEPMANLLVIEQRCLRIVARERKAQMIKNGLGNPGRVGVRFK